MLDAVPGNSTEPSPEGSVVVTVSVGHLVNAWFTAATNRVEPLAIMSMWPAWVASRTVAPLIFQR